MVDYDLNEAIHPRKIDEIWRPRRGIAGQYERERWWEIPERSGEQTFAWTGPSGPVQRCSAILQNSPVTNLSIFCRCAPPPDDPVLSVLHLRADRWDPQLPVRQGSEQASGLGELPPSGRHDAGLSG